MLCLAPGAQAVDSEVATDAGMEYEIAMQIMLGCMGIMGTILYLIYIKPKLREAVYKKMGIYQIWGKSCTAYMTGTVTRNQYLVGDTIGALVDALGAFTKQIREDASTITKWDSHMFNKKSGGGYNTNNYNEMNTRWQQPVDKSRGNTRTRVIIWLMCCVNAIMQVESRNNSAVNNSITPTGDNMSTHIGGLQRCNGILEVASTYTCQCPHSTGYVLGREKHDGRGPKSPQRHSSDKLTFQSTPRVGANHTRGGGHRPWSTMAAVDAAAILK